MIVLPVMKVRVLGWPVLLDVLVVELVVGVDVVVLVVGVDVVVLVVGPDEVELVESDTRESPVD